MKCNEICELLPDLAAGFTAPGIEVNDHLRTCAECAGTLNELRKTMALLDEWQAPEPSPYFDTRLQARLREEAARQPVSWLAWLRRPVFAVSMAIALVAGTTLFIEHKGSVPLPGPVTRKRPAGAKTSPLSTRKRTTSPPQPPSRPKPR